MDLKAMPKGKIKMRSNWHQWCRLCGCDYPDNLDVFTIQTRNLVMAIGKYFWVDIKINDELGQYLCRECHSLLEYLISFSEQVHRVQRMYEHLQIDNNLESDDIRKQFGNWVHSISFPNGSHNPDTETATKDLDTAIVDSLLIIEEQEVLEEEQNRHQVDEKHQEQEQGEMELLQDQDEGAEDQELYEEESQAHDEEAKDQEQDYERVDHNITTEVISEFDDDPFDDETSVEDDAVKLEPDISFRILEQRMEAEAKDNSELECILCSNVYRKATPYKRHLAKLHGIHPKDLDNCQCQQCDITFSTVNQLLVHYRTHKPIKEMKDNTCPMCSKVFTTTGALNRHIAGTHNKLTPYTCGICGKAVKTLASLKDHKLVHTDDCPFECDVCHRRFKNKARLRVHSDSHTEGYDCDICGMTLKTRRTLYTHRQVHSDERKCKCEVCGATFKRTKTLKSHLILHTGIRPYKCNFCGAEFANGSNCRMHKRKKHPKELAEEESRRVIRSTRLPLIDDLTEASKRIKTPARKAAVRTNTSKQEKSINPSVIAMEEENEYLLDNLVGEM
ncbi:zinc finger protein weckle isoform X1 [Drosophila tropicalis]|uniref:zinc finger protein weckle isoform X1 n=1 Tax=Drosophila tropicalis TaxID=46794 RepID=UPI0035ABE698